MNVLSYNYFLILGNTAQLRLHGLSVLLPPQIRCENLEMRKVFLHFRNKSVMQNSPPKLLAE